MQSATTRPDNLSLHYRVQIVRSRKFITVCNSFSTFRNKVYTNPCPKRNAPFALDY